MIVYSKKIILFIQEIKSAIKKILIQEIGVKASGNRFYNETQKYSYPIAVVIYNNKNMLGYFDAPFYELGFHERLMYSSKKLLHNIIRHELAHYFTFIRYGISVRPHGGEFKDFCQSMGWGEEVFMATTCLDDGCDDSVVEQSHILRKVQKLFALSTSSNAHEAEQAMVKAQQLLLKHHVDEKYISTEESDKMYLKRLLKQKKENAKMRAIARILETFFVNVIYRRGEEGICLEVVGTAVNVEIADYVADLLNGELERLWEQAKKHHVELKGAIAKNSFFLGMAKGYCNKIDALKRSYHTETANAVMVIEKQLVDAKAMIYSRLSSTKSSGNYCPESSAIGERMGKQLNINPGIKNSAKQSGLLIA